MDELFQLLGLVLPDTATMLRLKVAFGGICGLGAGVLYMASGLDVAPCMGRADGRLRPRPDRDRRPQSRAHSPAGNCRTGEVGLTVRRRGLSPGRRLLV
jgi:hypothetical protein